MRAWSNEQLQAIRLRKRELLVSAAAGSGKTTVLVERIIRWVTERGPDGEAPEDVDHFLIVTFTRAAAAEMRTRLYDRLMEEAEKAADTDRELARHIRRQLTLIGQAHVQTIDAFASFVLKNYFHEIGLDPSFRIGDEGELGLMRQDVLSELLEDQYKEADPGFLHCMEYFTAARKKDDISELLLKLYDYSQSAVYPEKWLESLAEPYRIRTVEELEAAKWNQEFYQFVREYLRGLGPIFEEAIAVSAAPNGPSRFIARLSEEKEKVLYAASSKDYGQFADRIDALKEFSVKPGKQDAGTSDALFSELQRLTGSIFKAEEELKKIFQYNADKILTDLRTACPAVEELAGLAGQFAERYRKEKEKHGLIDFSDAEHLALRILTGEDGAPTSAAKDLADHFREILIDEYQDSNSLQEALLGAVATKGPNGRNVFMVGDKKQSIYMFRRANPELFVDKFRRFQPAGEEPEGDGQTVELNANYRSRKEVADTVNFWFERLMRESVGSIEYNEREILRPKGEFAAEDRPADRKTAFLIADLKQASDNGSEDEEEDLGKVRSEAHLIAGEIRKLVDSGFPVQEKGPGGSLRLRKARYQDVVILVRSRSGRILETFTDVFAEYGIPCHAEARTGFYDTLEIRFAMNLLRVLSNPIDDTAFASVLKNPLSGFTNEDLARIVSEAGKGKKEDGVYKFPNGFFGRVRACMETLPEEDPLGRKLRKQMAQIERFRALSSEMPLSGFIRLLLRETGLSDFVSAMSSGKRRLANLEQLVERAREFEKTSYAGLFNFIRFIEKKAQTEIDEGEANVETEKDDVVRIMTMHGSKGLEFPIVFLPKMQQKIASDSGQVFTNSALGIGIRAVSLKTREQYDTYYENVLKTRNKAEQRGEELRILYVAMTRAKEKLYLTAALDDAGKTLDGYREHFREGARRLSAAEILSAGTVIEWLLLATDDTAPVELTPVPREDILAGYEKRETDLNYTRERLIADYSAPAPEAALQEVDRIISARYLRDGLYKVPASVTVSRLKAAAAERAEDPMEEHQVRLRWIRDDETPERITGRARGTLYHLVMERMDPHKDARSETARLTALGLTSQREEATIKSVEIDAFWASPLGKRFIRAYDEGRGFREKQFILAVPIREIPELFAENTDVDPEETVMVQGVIDLYFEEEDGLTVVDYKTDVVDRPEELVRRYEAQLRYYRKALEAMTGKTVKESYIWSFRLQTLIPV